VLVAYGQGGVVPSRSAFLNIKHVQSVLRRVRTEQSRYVEDPGAALEAWAEANRRDVFLFNGGTGGPTEKVRQAPVSRLQH
jgi:hypothetical protein